jgi:polar amino acid transport system substrate-binding protein
MNLLVLKRAVVLALVVVAGLGVSAEAQVLERILESGELRVGVSGSQPPFNVENRSGELMGLEIDLARMLAGAFDVEARFVERPFGELLAALDAGEVDIVMSGMAITPERSVRYEFVGPYMLSGKSILTNERALTEAAQADFNRADVKLAALENSTSQQFVERNLPEAQLVKVKDYDAGVRMVIADEVDALVADMPICVLSVMRYPNDRLATLEQPMTVEPIGIAMPTSDARLKSVVTSYVDTFERAGLLERLRKKWLEDGSWIAALP